MLNEDNTLDRTYYKRKVEIMSIYKILRLFISIVFIAFISGQVFYIYSNDIYML
jgi:hypothetical protein